MQEFGVALIREWRHGVLESMRITASNQYSNSLPSQQVFDYRALSVPSLTASRALVD